MSAPDTAGVLAVIPARYASSRFPGKPLARIAGVPLVLRVHARVTAAIPAAQVVVATDDARIRDACEAVGARVAMTAAGHRTGTDRAWEAARASDASIVLNVQGDEPLVDPADILAVLAAKRARPGAVVNATCPIRDPADVLSPHVPKVVAARDGRLAYISRAPIPFAARAGAPVAHRRQVCIYAFGRAELEAFAAHGARAGRSPLEASEDVEILRCLDLGIPVHMVEVPTASLAVDVPEDVARVEAELARRGAP